MNPLLSPIYEPPRHFPEEKKEEEQKIPEPSIPWGWEDTKNWSYR